jgi:protein-tyrosine-phosphatase
MASSIYNHLTTTEDASSAGTYVGADDVPEGGHIKDFFRKDDFFQVMERYKLFLRDKKMRKLTKEIMNDAEIIISMAEEPFIPDFLKKRDDVLWWDVENPAFVDTEIAEKTYKQIYSLVEDLLRNLSRKK